MTQAICDVVGNRTTECRVVARAYEGMPTDWWSYAWIPELLGGLILLLLFIRFSNIIRYIPNDQIGIVEKMFSRRGSVESGFIALNGEAGFQPEVLRGGLHFFFPFVYRVHKAALVTIPQGEMGYIFARDGAPLAPAQTLAANEADEDFQNVRRFLAGGGQKGPQRRVLREGTHPINLAQFVVLTTGAVYGLEMDGLEDSTLDTMRETIEQRHGYQPIIIRDTHDVIGVVTVHDGPSMAAGEIIAPISDGHDNFQRPEQFVTGGGFRGRQLQVLVEGTYFINRLFATVETINKTVIEIGTVGVVVSYTGASGTDVSGEAYKHGELVETGQRGVWRRPLLPGKYAFNTYAGHIVEVPTTNFVLKWVKSASGEHQLDANLSEVSLITKDAFEPILPLSVVLHIDYRKASELVQRFGDVRRLVEQTLDPMVSAYFKNVGQQKTLIQLLQERNEIQEAAGSDMRAKLGAYTLEFQEVLIGTPRPREGDETIEKILFQLRARQVAAEQQVTYASQQEAAAKERELNEAMAAAEAQRALTQSLINVTVAENQGAADLARATKDAETVRVSAQAEADRRRLEGEGEANAIAAVGAANAGAIDAQVKAYGGAEYRLAEAIAEKLFQAVAEGHQPIVPQIVVGGDSQQGMGPGGLVSGLLASLLPHAAPPPAMPPAARPNGSARTSGGRRK